MTMLERVVGVVVFTAALLVIPNYVEERFAPPPRESYSPAREAPIWSRLCEALGRDTVAHKADKGPWRVHCAKRGTPIRAKFADGEPDA